MVSNPTRPNRIEALIEAGALDVRLLDRIRNDKYAVIRYVTEIEADLKNEEVREFDEEREIFFDFLPKYLPELAARNSMNWKSTREAIEVEFSFLIERYNAKEFILSELKKLFLL